MCTAQQITGTHLRAIDLVLIKEIGCKRDSEES